MKRLSVFLLVAVSLLGTPQVPAAVAQTTPPTITFASADTVTKVLTVKGNYFGAVPKVFLGTSLGKLSSLSIVSKSKTSITARLTTVTPGSYLLVVANGTLRGSATITVGAVGPQGPPGTVGYACWDVDGSALCDLATEDLNRDGVCSIADCRMPVIQSGKDYSHQNLANSNFSGVILTGADFHQANVSFVDFSNANLSGANFASHGDGTSACSGTGAILSAANLSNANLTGANFTCATLSGANFAGATLVGVRYDRTICPDGSKSNHYASDPGTCVGHGGGL